MATFKTEIQNRRADGTYNIRIRVTHNRDIRRLSTHLFVTDEDITRGRKIKNILILEQCEALIAKCRNICNSMDFDSTTIPIDELVEKIKAGLLGKRFRLDFIEYTRQKTRDMNRGTAHTYTVMLNTLQRFIGCNTLDIADINTAFLQNFEKFIENEPSQQGSNRKTEKKDVKPKGGRAVSAYLAGIRAIHNKAKAEFNDEDRGVIRIPYSPFKNYKIKPQPKTRKRAIPVEKLQAIINLPYETDRYGGRWSRFNVAKDCFILSFVLIGMNSADMYHAAPLKKGVLTYNRKKTESRRDDNAEMRVKVHGCITYLMAKYRDPWGKRLFNFYSHYASAYNFNKALNAGLKQIGAAVGIDDLEFYAARHSWATIARSAAVGIDKATVHEALNHVDNEMKVTDIYIDKDWSVIWNANNDVLDLFDWMAVGYDVL